MVSFKLKILNLNIKILYVVCILRNLYGKKRHDARLILRIGCSFHENYFINEKE